MRKAQKPKAKRERKTGVFQMRVTEEQLERLKARADEAGKPSVSAYVLERTLAS